MTDTVLVEFLKHKGIYVTSTRVMVYRIMCEHKAPINAAQIHKQALFKLDRVSVYRTLQVFLKKEIINVIPKAKGWPKYLVKNFEEDSDVVKPDYINIYFTCKNCGKTTTHKAFTLSKQFVPFSYKVANCQIILEGNCNECTPD